MFLILQYIRQYCRGIPRDEPCGIFHLKTLFKFISSQYSMLTLKMFKSPKSASTANNEQSDNLIRNGKRGIIAQKIHKFELKSRTPRWFV